MKLLKSALNLVLVLAITTACMWGFGHVAFSESMALNYARLGGMLGFYGDESLEDLYLYITLAISLVIAGLLVWRGNVVIKRKSTSRT
ncbi:hypothetical protein F4827_006607 [Paraburkholderia bannensis]|uniref:Uncharacterized protein n=1 Tax=Paraburkholderia bannensis TaxID=765414 RepID=A0A7W9U5M8_9BURK|nr:MULTISPECIES: hypothetical protein [Paraburkholderia]MBB3261769.1 hypothetical protein [Paraburkholderia sp. WP4_3_2]MBB6106731.1 hypothetical protein [Paraburkholderia bannensis]